MKGFNLIYLKAWDLAEKHNGDFKDCLLFYLKQELGIISLKVHEGGPEKYTDGGVVEMGGSQRPEDYSTVTESKNES